MRNPTGMACPNGNLDQIAYWNEVAGGKWVRNQARLDRLMAPLTEALIERAAPRAGERVLDIGCGCGDLALRLAALVGPGGRVSAIDVSRPMLAHAAVRAASLSETCATVDWIDADASSHRFPEKVDLLASRFGVMFFDDGPAAFRNLRSSLRPGGRFAFLAWRSRAEVEWMQAPLEWLASVLDTPELSDGEIGPFALADGETTCRMLADAGFEQVCGIKLDHALAIGRDVEDAVAMLADTGPAAGLLREAEPAQRIEGERVLRDHLRHHAAVDGSVTLSAACWLFTGRV